MYAKEVLSGSQDLQEYELYKIDRAVENPNVDIFLAISQTNELLVKKFNYDHEEAALREYSQYKVFAQLPFIPKMVSASRKPDGIYIAYEKIQGENLYESFKKASTNEIETIYKKVIDQTIKLGNIVPGDIYGQLQKNGTKFSLSNPLYRNVLSSYQEKEFDEEYKEVLNTLNLIGYFFPGLYTDRNPGNILKTNTGEIFLIDFGVIEATSPIFDLTKLLRTNTGESSLITDQSFLNDELFKTSSVTKESEKDIIRFAFNAHRENSKYNVRGSEELFMRGFLFAALNEHIFYLSKAARMLLTRNANDLVQKQRARYHRAMLEQTFENLLELGEPIDRLQPSINNLIGLAG